MDILHEAEVHPGLMRDRQLIKAEHQTGLPLRLVYLALQCCCDNQGHFRWWPKTLKQQCFAREDINMAEAFHQLMQCGYIQRWSEQWGQLLTPFDKGAGLLNVNVIRAGEEV